MFEGLVDRLKAEISSLAPANFPVDVTATADRKFAVWKGASTLSTLSSFDESKWMSKEDFEEHGASYVHAKCQ